MVDCGEGTQGKVRSMHMNFSKLYAIFISHIHGDHVLGLMGMLSTFGLQGRTAPLHVYAPEGYQALFEHEKEVFLATMDYDIIFHPVDTTKQQVIYEDRSLTVETIPLKHRMPCAGFLFKEKAGLRHIKPEALKVYDIPLSQADNLRNGLDWIAPDSTVVENAKLTTDPDPVRAYAYCSDTCYLPKLGETLRALCNNERNSWALTLYHEATYCEDMKDKAKKYLHSTAREAAMVAKDAQAKELVLGHFSQRYLDETPLLKEAKEMFENTRLATEGKAIKL